MKGHKASKGVQALLSCLAYSFCSVGMVLSNKAIATSGIKGVSLLLVSYQCLVAVVLVELARRLGYVENYSFSWDTVKKWVPVNIFFCLMLYTSFMALKW
jgi:GDP-mannose transporter